MERFRLSDVTRTIIYTDELTARLSRVHGKKAQPNVAPLNLSPV